MLQIYNSNNELSTKTDDFGKCLVRYNYSTYFSFMNSSERNFAFIRMSSQNKLISPE
jgi:hypothetical protein